MTLGNVCLEQEQVGGNPNDNVVNSIKDISRYSW